MESNVYEEPSVEVLSVIAEGILCASTEGLTEESGVWE